MDFSADDEGVGGVSQSGMTTVSPPVTLMRSAAAGTAAQNDALAARQGAYGGSAWAQKQSQDALGLENSVAQMANNYQLQRMNTGAQDYQSGIGQMLQAANLGANDWQSGMNNMQQAAAWVGSPSLALDTQVRGVRAAIAATLAGGSDEARGGGAVA